jgi:hypothetical protein
MIGVLATVLVQSSSTSTSIVVTMVASGSKYQLELGYLEIEGFLDRQLFSDTAALSGQCDLI